MLWQPRACRSSMSAASSSARSSAPSPTWLTSQFWQNTQRRLQNEKKIVPEPFQPRRQSSSPKCGNADATRACRPVKHAVPLGTCAGTARALPASRGGPSSAVRIALRRSTPQSRGHTVHDASSASAASTRRASSTARSSRRYPGSGRSETTNRAPAARDVGRSSGVPRDPLPPSLPARQCRSLTAASISGRRTGISSTPHRRYLRPPLPSTSSALREVALVFLKLGCTAFGGPAAHLAMQEEECVRRRGWLDRQRFLDLLAATNLIPGPNSTEMAIHLGRLRAGWPGLVVGGLAFVAPSTVLVTLLAWAYTRWGALPEATGLLAALRPAVLVVILDALFGFARTAVRGPATLVAALAAIALGLGGVSDVALVFAALAIGLVVARIAPGRLRAVPLLELFLVCTKIGATLFGSGYVLIAYLRSEIVGRGWLDDGRLLDAVAIGQITPGPVSTAATFVGYLLAGPAGAGGAPLGVV